MMGLPYLDSMYQRAQGYEKKETGEKTVLLSPTWGPNSILVKFGSSFIDRLIETGYNIIIRPHPQSYTADKDTIEMLMNKYPETDKLHWNRDNDNFDVLASADIMISDYSGVMYDFIFIFNKPVIYTTEGYTKDPYDCWCLEGETWMVSTIRKLGKELTKENAENIKELIDTSISEGVDPVEVEQARIETWCNVGNSASLIADYIIDKLAGIEAERQKRLDASNIEASKEYDEIVNNANKKADKIIQDAKLQAEKDAEAKQHEMQQQMAVLVAQAAYKIAASKDSSENDEKLYDTFLSENAAEAKKD
jgi:hypothetical protein